ncbi:transposase, partial [Acidomonas methanolica]
PALMRRIDELFLTWPFLGSRRMTAMLRAETLTKTADAASEKLWSGYALPTFPACSAKWPTFTPPSGRFLRRR